MPLTPGTTLGSYQVTAKIGEGGMGEVWQARDTKLDRDVALKVLPEAFTSDPDRLARFEREAKVLASLNHPNIGSIYGLEEAEGVKALVLELIEGPTLADRIKQGPIPIDEALPIAKQIAEAIEAAHEQGVIHRDLKPANIKVKDDGTVKVLDFGLAKAFQPDSSNPNVSASPTISLTAAATQMGMVIGTAAYMAPEQAKGKPVDKRADIWAFGAVLYEMLTGQKPFVGDDVSDTLAAVLRAEVDLDALPDGVSATLRKVVSACLQRDPKQRVHDVADLRLAMEGAFETAAGTPSEPATARRFHVWQRPIPAALVVLVVAAIASLAGWSLRPSTPRAVTRFEYDLPPSHVLRGTTRPVLAVSPDGRRFVYNTAEGLYLRSMDALAARLLPGIEGEFVESPVFSPGGQSLAYVNRRDRQLKRLALSGGAPVVLGDAARPTSVSWASDGTIFFSVAAGIMRVSANGGTPELVLPAAEGEALDSPQLLPDGDSVLLTVGSDSRSSPRGRPVWTDAQIAIHSLTSGVRTVLLPGADARYVSTGHLVYALDDGLFGVAFDADSLTISGGAVSLVQGVARATFAASANYAVADDGTLMYLAGSGASDSRLVWVDRDGREEPVDAPIRHYRAVALSPDRERVAVGVFDTGGNEDVWVWDLLRRTFTRLTRDEGSERNPIWTPDGARVVFESDSGMFWMVADGTGDIEQIPGSEPGSTPFTWAGDGRLVFDFLRPDGRDIRAMPLDGDAAETLLDGPFGEQRGTIAPDGRWLAYESRQSGDYEIYVRPFPDVDAGRWQISTSGGLEPKWSPDGSELFYVEPSSDRLVVARVNPAETFEWDAPEALFSIEPYTRDASRNYAVDRDGRRFLFKRSASGSEDGTEDRPKVVVVQNWVEELKARVPIP